MPPGNGNLLKQFRPFILNSQWFIYLIANLHLIKYWIKFLCLRFGLRPTYCVWISNGEALLIGDLWQNATAEWLVMGSHNPSQVLAHSSLPWLRRKSISSCVNVAIDMDFTRCGGVRPRLEKRQTERYCNANPFSIKKKPFNVRMFIFSS